MTVIEAYLILCHRVVVMGFNATFNNISVISWRSVILVEETAPCRKSLTNFIIFNYNGTNIEIVKDFNYLGIYFSRTGSFKVCKNHLSEKAIKAMYEVIKKGRKQNLSISCQLDPFDKIVKPILLYGCEIWGSAIMTFWKRYI